MGIIHKPDVAECDGTGARQHLANNEVSEEEEDIDTMLPAGWVSITARRVVANPAYIIEQQQRAAYIESQLQQLRFMAQQQGEEPPEELEDEIREQSEMRLGAALEAPYKVEELSIVLSPEVAPWLQEKLQAEPWESDDG